SLEWQTPSPPPDWNFAAIPIVRSRHPNWEPERPYAAESDGAVARTPGVSGALARETPFTDGYDGDAEAAFAVPRPTYLPFAIAVRRGYDTGVWGVALVIATELVLFGGLLSSYFFLRATSPRWPPPGIETPTLDWRPWVFSAVLLASSLPLFHAERAHRRGHE